MIDRMSPEARLAPLRPKVIHEQPSWLFEIGASIVTVALCVVMAVLAQLAVVANEREDAFEEASFWRELALAPESEPTVRLHHDGRGFQCTQFAIPDEWQAAVAEECDAMGRLLQATKRRDAKIVKAR